jgi:hypothetical protein
MNHAEMVVLIVAIVMIASVLRAKYRGGKDARGNDVSLRDPNDDRLRDEVKQLKERIAVLERLATDSTNSLDREIEKLRDRDRV